MINIEELESSLKTYKIAKDNLDKTKEITSLIGKEGHCCVGKWLPDISIKATIAYQEKVGSTTYHETSILSKKIENLVKDMFPSLVDKAVNELEEEFMEASKAFNKYEVTQ